MSFKEHLVHDISILASGECACASSNEQNGVTGDVVQRVWLLRAKLSDFEGHCWRTELPKKTRGVSTAHPSVATVPLPRAPQ